MKRLLVLALIGFALNAQAQDFTQSVVTITYTNVEAYLIDPATSGMQMVGTNLVWVTNKVLDANFDGKGWNGQILIQRSDGRDRQMWAKVNQAKILKAANDTAGITMDANATNVIKKLGKIVEKAFRREGNVIIDSGILSQ